MAESIPINWILNYRWWQPGFHYCYIVVPVTTLSIQWWQGLSQLFQWLVATNHHPYGRREPFSEAIIGLVDGLLVVWHGKSAPLSTQFENDYSGCLTHCNMTGKLARSMTDNQYWQEGYHLSTKDHQNMPKSIGIYIEFHLSDYKRAFSSSPAIIRQSNKESQRIAQFGTELLPNLDLPSMTVCAPHNDDDCEPLIVSSIVYIRARGWHGYFSSTPLQKNRVCHQNFNNVGSPRRRMAQEEESLSRWRWWWFHGITYGLLLFLRTEKASMMMPTRTMTLCAPSHTFRIIYQTQRQTDSLNGVGRQTWDIRTCLCYTHSWNQTFHGGE